MKEFNVRGYAIVQAADYLRKVAGQRAIDALSPELRAAVNTATPAGWQPAALMAETFDAIAKLGNGDEKKAREHLENAGEHQAITSTGTFLKLIMKVLSPSILAKKFPSLWARDATAGTVTVDLFEDHVLCHLHDMEPLGHFPPASAGYTRYLLKAMGMNITKMTVDGWSLQGPPTAHASFGIYWKV